MSKTAQRTDPKLWDKVKSKVTRSGKGGEPGQWSARKAQLAVQEYKKRGGDYLGKKSADNSLKQWSDEDWDTKSGRDSRRAGERCLPRAKADADYGKASSAKRGDTKKGKHGSSKAEGVADKTAQQRSTSTSPTKTRRPAQNKDELLKQARYLDIEGRSNMLKTELQEAIRLAKH